MVVWVSCAFWGRRGEGEDHTLNKSRRKGKRRRRRRKAKEREKEREREAARVLFVGWYFLPGRPSSTSWLLLRVRRKRDVKRRAWLYLVRELARLNSELGAEANESIHHLDAVGRVSKRKRICRGAQPPSPLLLFCPVKHLPLTAAIFTADPARCGFKRDVDRPTMTRTQ